MNAREIIAKVIEAAGHFKPTARIMGILTIGEAKLLADLADEGIESLRALVESEGLQDGEWWNVSHEWIGGANEKATQFAIKMLDRAGEVTDDTAPSCSLAEALERQELFVNQAVATWALELLWRLFRYGRVEWHGAFVNLASGRATPLPVDPEAWARMGAGKPRRPR